MHRDALQTIQASSNSLADTLLVSLNKKLAPICLALLLMASVTIAAEVPKPPDPPADPKSEDQCRDYQRQQNQYAQALAQQNEECVERGLKEKNAEIITFDSSCGLGKVTSPRQCQEVSKAATCSTVGFGKKYADCLKQAQAAERKPFDDAVKKNSENQSKEAAKLFREQCMADSVLPKPDGCKALQGAGFEELKKN
jgi:hypothetical protein